jgi:hypothetical protein
MAEYEGWKNRATWNCALCINNDEPLYRAAVKFMKDYKGNTPYKSFCRESGLDVQRTPDNILWVSQILDYQALNDMMLELAPEGSRNV